MKAQELSQKYAAAVFSLALEKWLTTLRGVHDKLTSDSALLATLSSSESFSSRQKELDKVIPDESDQSLYNFLYAMLKEGDIDLLGNVIADLDRLSRGGPQVQVASVTTALALSDQDKDQFRQKLRAKYGAGLEFVFNVNPSIIGGAIVQVGDQIIDGSVSAKLESMSNLLGVK